MGFLCESYGILFLRNYLFLRLYFLGIIDFVNYVFKRGNLCFRLKDRLRWILWIMNIRYLLKCIFRSLIILLFKVVSIRIVKIFVRVIF